MSSKPTNSYPSQQQTPSINNQQSQLSTGTNQDSKAEITKTDITKLKDQQQQQSMKRPVKTMKVRKEARKIKQQIMNCCTWISLFCNVSA